MKTATPAVTAFINAVRTNPDSPVAFAECFTFTLLSGAVYAWTNVDIGVAYNGLNYLANGPLVQGLKYKASVGLEVDKQQISIAARPTDVLNGSPILAAIREGALDGAAIQRDRVFLADMNAWNIVGQAIAPGMSVVGGATLFHGRVSTVDLVGRTSAVITVASDLVVLDYDVPRNVYSPTCIHTLYDSGCAVVRGTYASNGVVGSGSTTSQIYYSGSSAANAQGAIVFTSGVNANVRATVKSVSIGNSLTLIYPLPATPAADDGFTVYAGCDHTLATCSSRFANAANFRGFPYVPPPQLAY